MAADASWIDHFPGLQRLSGTVRDQLVRGSKVVDLPEHSRIFGPGQAPENFLLLLDGTVRVQQASESGREIVLYRVSAGETCALTTACLLAYEDYQAEGITETAVRAVAVGRSVFDDLIASSAEFRRFVFTAFSRRVTDLFRLIEDVAFARLDVRLAQRLLQLADPDGRVHATHQQLASELGTAREVISRQLTDFQRREWIKVLRGTVEIADRPALLKLSQHPV
ncbi:MAG: Crp/Fnr family transcriptional regulator [Hyphomicrobiales bacterium]|nr:Crp/Fnr family transcriptional regulator [Hyphomicrobiales bacterium]